MPVMSKYKPIGLIPIFNEIPSENYCEDDSFKRLKKAHNYDCTVQAPGHTLYNDSADAILERIPHSF